MNFYEFHYFKRYSGKLIAQIDRPIIMNTCLSHQTVELYARKMIPKPKLYKILSPQK